MSKPFPSTHPHVTSGDKFPSALFLNFAQAIASCLFATLYLTIGSWRDGTLHAKGTFGVLGISQLGTIRPKSGEKEERVKVNVTHGSVNGTTRSNGNGNGHGHGIKSENKADLTRDDKTTEIITSTVAWRKTLPVLLLQVSLLQTMAGPIGFSALRHISYPTMVLGKVSHDFLTGRTIREMCTGD